MPKYCNPCKKLKTNLEIYPTWGTKLKTINRCKDNGLILEPILPTSGLIRVPGWCDGREIFDGLQK